ncbi:MAG: AMP-binding protein, partial [Candidatus Aminicenantes bacterium]
EKYLCAYIAANEEVDISELRRMLSKSLPDYMIPSYFVQVENIPLTPNKKVDIKALPEPELKAGQDYTAPRDEVEDRLAGLWAQVLRIKKEIIGIDNDFFELGGHSLNATLLIANIHKEMRVKVPLSEIFRTPTIRELSEYIKCAKQEIFASIEAVEEKYYYETSSAQRRLYILQQMSLNLTNYNIPQAMALEGIVDKGRMEETLTELIHRHESLRTSFTVVNDEPVQELHDKVEFKIEYYDLNRTEVEAEEERSSFLEGTRGLAPLPIEPAAALINSFIRPFDLSQAPLLRVGLIELPHTLAALRTHPRPGTYTSQEGKVRKYILMVDMHHIITDGTSMGVFVKEFMELYEGKELSALKIQYKDFSQWQNNLIRSGKIKEQELFWMNQFKGEIPVLHLPYDFKRPVIQDFAGDAKNFMLEKRETAALKEIARQENTTLFIVLLAVYNIFISKLSGQEDIVIGSPIACRRHADLKNVMGMMVNTLALKNFPVGEKTIKDFLRHVNERTLQAFENQEYQFEDLVEKVNVRRDTGRNPLFDVAFVLQNMAVPQLEIRELALKSYEYENKTSKFDMMFTGFEAHDRLVFSVEYCTKLFKGETIERFIKYFKKIIFEVMYDTGKKLSQIEIISEEIKRQILDEFNNTHSQYPEDKTIHQLFEEQAARKPDNIALVGRSPKSRIPNKKGTMGLAPLYITYRELNEKSGQLAKCLREKGIKGDNIVAIMVERSIEMIIGLFGILKAGGAYLPLDPDYPKERINYMLKDSGAKILLSEGRYPDFPASQVPSFPASLPSSLAYIIYTSGS